MNSIKKLLKITVIWNIFIIGTWIYRPKVWYDIWIFSACNANDLLCVYSSHKASNQLFNCQPQCFKGQHEERRWRQGRGQWPFIWPVGTRLCISDGKWPVICLYQTALPVYLLLLCSVCFHVSIIFFFFVWSTGWAQECIWRKTRNSIFAIWQL